LTFDPSSSFPANNPFSNLPFPPIIGVAFAVRFVNAAIFPQAFLVGKLEAKVAANLDGEIDGLSTLAGDTRVVFVVTGAEADGASDGAAACQIFYAVQGDTWGDGELDGGLDLPLMSGEADGLSALVADFQASFAIADAEADGASDMAADFNVRYAISDAQAYGASDPEADTCVVLVGQGAADTISGAEATGDYASSGFSNGGSGATGDAGVTQPVTGTAAGMCECGAGADRLRIVTGTAAGASTAKATATDSGRITGGSAATARGRYVVRATILGSSSAGAAARYNAHAAASGGSSASATAVGANLSAASFPSNGAGEIDGAAAFRIRFVLGVSAGRSTCAMKPPKPVPAAVHNTRPVRFKGTKVLV
jgi:hypothetical protein